jgi:hypothetical protein
MPFRKPVSTQGGLTFWKNIKQSTYFIMQKHKTGLWPYKYRILLRENSKEIANANDLETIGYDWDYLQDHAVPRANEQGFLDINKLVEIIINKKVGL